MKLLIPVFVMLVAVPAGAAEQKITETETGITVEYTGTPSSAPEARGAQPAQPGQPAADAKVRSLAAQISQLRKEAAELSQLTGTETPEELALKKGLADEKRGQIDVMVQQFNQLTGTPAAEGGASDATQDAAKQTRVPNYRAEKKQQIRELKLLRQTAPPP